MAGSGRKQRSGFSSQGLIPLQHLLVTWLLPVVITVPVYLRCWLFIDWEGRESWWNNWCGFQMASIVFFLILLFHHFFKNENQLHVNNLLAFHLVGLPPPLLPSLSDNETHNLLYVSLSFHCYYKWIQQPPYMNKPNFELYKRNICDEYIKHLEK